MIKKLIAILCLVPAISIAGDSFDNMRGILHIPAVSVGSEKFEVNMLHQGGYIFKVTSVTPTDLQSTPDTYDPDTGIVHMPMVVVGSNFFEVEMTHQGDLVFQVTYTNPIGAPASTSVNYYSSGKLVENNNISAWFDRSLDVYGIRLFVAGDVGGQVAVPEIWAKKIAQTFKLLMDKNATGINENDQLNMLKVLKGEIGFHKGYITGQRIGYGGGGEYSPNPLTDEGMKGYSGYEALRDEVAMEDMIWYANIDSLFTGDNDIAEVLEHTLHTLHVLGARGAVSGSTDALNAESTTSELYLAMVEAVDNGVFGLDGYGGTYTDQEAIEVILKEYQYLLTFAMWGFGVEFWEDSTLAPEWNDNSLNALGVRDNNPLGYALFNKYYAPIISKPSITTLRSLFQNNDLGDSGYVPD